MKHDGNAVAVLLGEVFVIQLHQISSQFILITVYFCLDLLDTLCLLFLIVTEQSKRNIQSLAGITLHMSCCISSLLYGKSRFFQKSGFQDHELLIFLADFIGLVVTDRETGKFHKKVREWKPCNRRCDIEDTVCDRDRCRCCHLRHKWEMYRCIDKVKQ